ncbi:MAG: RNA polymerase subunit sigma-24 [Microbacterium sp.]|uniref:RNA polymerase sigma factor n=1 Tax=unclassified Microbacterium TaxID=2609290 RepID=UPI000DB44ED9|nr:RNA polymerase sigma factor [Microbacterium sp.]PZU37308.1 MAG: RNA polymerase subunit sigma-24 [Microbacterium sp.]
MAEPVDVDDRTLVAQAAAGSEHAFRTLYRAYARPVYWVAFGLLGDAADAEDIAQETFVTAWRKLPGFELASDSLLPWLCTICRFQAANRLRARRRDREHTAGTVDESVPAAIDVEQQVIDAHLAERILREVEGLSPVDREIFVLCAAQGMSYLAAAEQLGVPHGVVRNRLSRIRTRLRTALTETS